MNGLEIIFPQCRTVCLLLLSANIDFSLYGSPPLASALVKWIQLTLFHFVSLQSVLTWSSDVCIQRPVCLFQSRSWLKLCAISDLRNFFKGITSEMCVEFFFTGIKAQWDKGGGRILLGDYTGAWAIVLQLMSFHCVGVWISTGLPFLCERSWP